MPSTSLSLPGAAAPVARPAGFYLLASITISFLAGSSAPTPLYPVYQALWGFSPATLTAVFSSYVLVLLAALLVFGRLSDHVGRKPVILVATLMQLVAMAVFAGAQGVAALYAARIIQGIATGAAIAAVGAGMLDLDRAKGTIANAVAPALGTALGGVIAGLLVHYLPAPTHLVYGVLAVIFLVSYVAMGLPALVAGLIAARTGNLPATGLGLATLVLLLALLALRGLHVAVAPAPRSIARVLE
jgi:MFS family permease